MIILQRGLFSLAAATVLCAVPAHADCYDYDDLGRLIAVDYDGDTSKSTYVLDEHGNRQSVSVAGQGGACTAPVASASSGVSSAENSSDYIVNSSGSAQNSSDSGGSYSNIAPIADSEFIEMPMNSSQTIQPLIGDRDADGGVLSIVSAVADIDRISIVRTGDTLEVSSGDSPGLASITYVISDGQGASANGTIGVYVMPEETTNLVTVVQDDTSTLQNDQR